MAQTLEAWRPAEMQLDYIGQVAVLGVEEADRLAGGERQVVVNGGQGFNTWPVVDPFNQVAGDGVGDGIDYPREDILGFDQLDRGGLFACPERFPPSAKHVLMLGEKFVKVFEKVGQPAVVVDDGVVVVAGGADADDADAGLASGQRETIYEGIVGFAARAHEETALGAATRDHVAATRDDGARK